MTQFNLIPKEKCLITAICTKGNGEFVTYYFKDAQELENLCKDTKDFRCTFEYLPENKTYISNFSNDITNIKSGDYYCNPIQQDRPKVYSAEFYLADTVPSPLLNGYTLSNHIDRYLIVLDYSDNNKIRDSVSITIFLLDMDRIVSTCFTKNISLVDINNELMKYVKNNPTEDDFEAFIKTIGGAYVHAFCSMRNESDVIAKYMGENQTKDEEHVCSKDKCHCECNHEEFA